MLKALAKGVKRLGIRIEEAILVGIIILNILDFLEILSGDLDYIKKIISWSALGFLLYQASLTKIFFGKRHKTMDIWLILTYFILIFKNFIAFSTATIESTFAYVSFFYRFLIQNAQLIEEFSFYIGGTMLVVLAMWAAYKYDILVPSLMHVIHEEGPHPKTVSKFVLRSSIILMVFIFFFIVVFNLIMEWLALAVDAPLLMLGIFFYLFKAKDFHTESLIYKLGNMGEEFYESFIELFHSKKRFFLGISGMLVLHLLTDVGNFVIPHMMGLHDHLYFSALGPGHTPIPVHILSDLQGVSIFPDGFVIMSTYLLNAFGIMLLLLAPGFLWYTLFKDVQMRVSNGMLALFASSVAMFLLAPVFKIGSIESTSLVGVDITTQAASLSNFPLMSALILSLSIGLLVYLLCHNQALKRMYLFLAILVSLGFFSMYIYYYFIDVSLYYIESISLLFAHSKFFVGFLLISFFITTIGFYLGGLILFFYELIRN